MRFWDSSALLPLLVDEPARERLMALLEEDGEVLAWWGTPVEIASALARREREGLLTPDDVAAALDAARALAESWHEIVPSDAVRRTAERLLRTHPTSLELVCLDERLKSAARREGFTVLGS